jgi:prepilin-type N-terminal cleavage/methylation domain-containing protein
MARKPGFTLIERLVIIVIIAILAALGAYPFHRYAKARERARANTCLGNMKQIAFAILLYAEDSPSASGARGFNRGSLFSRDGRLVASVAQEGLIRVRQGDGTKSAIA